jgi:hypothetical protein
MFIWLHTTVEACRRAGIVAVSARQLKPIEKLMLKLTTKSQIEFGQPILADSSTTADCYYVRQPCGKPFVSVSLGFDTVIHSENHDS